MDGANRSGFPHFPQKLPLGLSKPHFGQIIIFNFQLAGLPEDGGLEYDYIWLDFQRCDYDRTAL
jgi:hypothetical protein